MTDKDYYAVCEAAGCADHAEGQGPLLPDVETLCRFLREEAGKLRDIEEWHFMVRSLESWSEEDGEVLWWRLPVEEAPYVGSPLCDDWPGYHTHWTKIPVPWELPPEQSPSAPKGGET